MSCRAWLVTAVMLLSVRAVAAGARTDSIILKNGDRFTGEVIQMRQGKLQVKTDDAGTLSIEWDKVASITTADQYDVTLRNGSHRLGRFRPGTGGAAELLGIGGTATSIRVVG